jgi:hypothetical protein
MLFFLCVLGAFLAYFAVNSFKIAAELQRCRENFAGGIFLLEPEINKWLDNR